MPVVLFSEALCCFVLDGSQNVLEAKPVQNILEWVAYTLINEEQKNRVAINSRNVGTATL